jgi:type IX secretion system PorP/SprF family membrane protein
MKRKVLFVATVLSLLAFDFAFAQDPEFTQFYANPLYLNPAFAGTAKCPRAVLNYRNQWPAISGTFVTYSASYDQHIDILTGGIGVLITEDRAGEGTLNTLNASFIYSKNINVTKEFSLRFAGQGTYMQKRLDWNRLTFGDQIDPRRGFVWETNEPRGVNSVTNVDFSFGALGFSRKYFFGFAAHHLTQPNESLLNPPGASPLPMKFTGHAGIVIPLEGDKGNASISPNILYQYQGRFQQLCLGLYVNKGPIVGGLWYRNQDSFIALVGLQYGIFKFGYSYDVTVSKLSNATAGSHEVSLTMNFQCGSKTQKFRVVNCPSF